MVSGLPRVRDTSAMIAGMSPELDSNVYHFCTVSEDEAASALLFALASFREAEGLSLILSENAATQIGLISDVPMRRITLNVHSALDGVGLTAAVAGVLAANGIPCNMVAANHHDHAFVPEKFADKALALLMELSGAQLD